MKNRIATYTLISLAALGSIAFAQTSDPAVPQAAPQASAPAHHQATPQQQVNRLTKRLSLTADQQSQILPILTDRDQQVADIQNNTALTPKERHSKLMAVRSDAQSRMRTVLTDSQRAAYDQMQQEAREREKARKQNSTPNR